MQKSIWILFIAVLFTSCEEGFFNKPGNYEAIIEGFDNNCSTCLISFVNKNRDIIDSLGKSPENIYNAINLNQNEYNVGQKLSVKARKLRDNELMACKTQYPTLDYLQIYLTEFELISDFSYGDTIEIAYGECLNDYKSETKICFDKVVSDSRCPIDVNCIWEGEATLAFSLQIKSSDLITIELSTLKRDTVMEGYSISLVELKPYPRSDFEIHKHDYRAKVVVVKEK